MTGLGFGRTPELFVKVTITFLFWSKFRFEPSFLNPVTDVNMEIN